MRRVRARGYTTAMRRILGLDLRVRPRRMTEVVGSRYRDRLGLVLGVALLAFVVSRAPLGEIVAACSKLGPMLLALPLLALGWHACNTSAFRVLLGGDVPWRTLYWNRLVGDGYNNLLPLAGLGGEPFKLRHLSRYVPADRAGVALVRDRVIESGFGFLTTGLLLVWAVSALRTSPSTREGLWAAGAGAIVAALLAGALAVSALPGRLAARLTALFGAGGVETVGTLDRRRLGRVVCWHLPARVLGLLEVALLLWLLGVDLSFARVALVDSVMNVAGVLGFLFPQGLGVLEGATVYAFSTLGHSGAAAIAFALSRRARLLVLAGIGVGLHTMSGRDVRGRPRSGAAWDADYRNGAWQFLESPGEAGHYALIAGLVQRFAAGGTLLDVGCGTGVLYDLLRHTDLGSYHGIDSSVEAIREAHTRAGPNGTFGVADFDANDAPVGDYDAVVFNESIYYAVNPGATLLRYLEAARPGGVVIVSIRRRLRNRRIRRSLHRHHAPALCLQVRNHRRERWDVDVYVRPG